MNAKDTMAELVERFDLHRDAYKAATYNETQVRREFIDPMFKALGWDVDNTEGYAEQYKEVVHEDAIKVGGVTRAPDYCFRIGGARKFFLEAKKPAVNLKDDPSPAYQLRRYAWTAKMPLSILTDFEEFIVYDTRVKPAAGDKASKARTLYVPYRDYLERWGEIESVFSRKAILKGAFDKYAESATKKKGTAEVDDAFLAEIEEWRVMLARNIALRNPDLTQRDLNNAVQRTIDRIIFLRICEDRGIEEYGRLQALLSGDQVYPRMTHIFRQADDRYNSGLFHFRKEKDREAADTWTLALSVDDKCLKDILKRLYYPDSPYEFSVLPADILGNVYERFLGSVITLTKGHRAAVEEKPEVRKAGGVYYTPKYIVDYIVEHTVGKLLEGKTPQQAAGRTAAWKPAKGKRPIAILDPACGSGSFLLGAYQYLLDWYLAQYAGNNKKWSKGKEPVIFEHHKLGWRLSTKERKRILLDHIHGVDIDTQAVEVTKLSLLLKVLEEESAESLGQTLALFHERALPDLGNNIKCGNSLIGPDFYHGKQLDAFDEEEIYRVNAFDWDAEFPVIMGGGGFDAVIGNPPYVDIKGMPEQDVCYIFNRYAFANNRLNLFACFIERGFHLLRPGDSRFSMIVPTALLAQSSYMNLRRAMQQKHALASLVRLPNESFGASTGDVKVDTVIFVCTESGERTTPVEVIAYQGYERVSEIIPQAAHIHGSVAPSRWTEDTDCVWSLGVTDEHESVLRKCEAQPMQLQDCVEFCLGITPYDKYRGHTPEQIAGRVFHAPYRKDDTYRRLLLGNDVRRYWVTWNGENWISYGPWLGAPRAPRFFTEPRILVKQIIDWSDRRIWSSFVSEELYNTQNAFNLLVKDGVGLSLYFLNGILNSRLMSFYHRKRYLDEFKMRFQKVLIKDCRRLPVPAIDLSKGKDRAAHDQVTVRVKQMLSLHEKLGTAKSEHARTVLQRQIEATDEEIDRLVYELYDLTDGEIAIVEGNG